MTETRGVMTALDPDDRVHEAGSAGKSCPHVAVRLVRADGGEALPGEMGEVWVKGPSVTPGPDWTEKPDKPGGSGWGVVPAIRL